MKITIIGSNPEYFSFIENSQVVEDYNEADVIIFTNGFNFRSAAMKFSKISSDKLVVGVGDTGCEFLVKRYNGIPIKNIYVKPMFTNKTIPFDAKNDFIYECVPQSYFYLPKAKYVSLLSSNIMYYVIRNLNREAVDFINNYKLPIISLMKSDDKPYCMTIGLAPKYISKTSVTNYINKILCEYQTLL